MQQAARDYGDAGVEIYALSYDSVDVLSRFAESREITYQLLSDPDSTVMQRLGLLNTEHIEQQQAFYGVGIGERHRGLPYPGTFVLDEQGVVVSKHFEQSYRDRPSGRFLLEDVGAGVADRPYEARSRDSGIAISAWVDQVTYSPLQKANLHVLMELADGLHVYTEPVPQGYVAISFDILSQDGLKTWGAELPAGSRLNIDGLVEEFYVLEDAFEVAVPYTISGRRHLPDGRERNEPKEDGMVVLTLVVRFQACTGSECFPPTERRLSIPLLEGRFER